MTRIAIACFRMLKIANGWIRYNLGECPECNSSAPELYNCTVCKYGTVKRAEVWKRFKSAATMMLIAGLALALLGGCTQTRITTPTWSLTRTSVLQRTEVPQITVLTDGSIEVQGYSNDGGNAAVSAIVEAAVVAAIKAGVMK